MPWVASAAIDDAVCFAWLPACCATSVSFATAFLPPLHPCPARRAPLQKTGSNVPRQGPSWLNVVGCPFDKLHYADQHCAQSLVPMRGQAIWCRGTCFVPRWSVIVVAVDQSSTTDQASHARSGRLCRRPQVLGVPTWGLAAPVVWGASNSSNLRKPPSEQCAPTAECCTIETQAITWNCSPFSRIIAEPTAATMARYPRLRYGMRRLLPSSNSVRSSGGGL